MSPARAAQVTASGLANLEKMIADECGGAFGYLLPIPPVDEGNESDPNSQFRTDLAKARGNTLTIASVALDEDNIGRVGARSQTVQRFGGSPPATISELRRDGADQILAACGLSAALWSKGSDGTARRESYREAFAAGLRPTAALMMTELRRKLDLPDISIDMSNLAASDSQGRGRAFGAFTSGGMDPRDAAREVGATLGFPTRSPLAAAPGDGDDD